MTLSRSLPALVARLRARCDAVGLLSWSGRRRAEQDVQRELALHLELETQQNIEQGMSPENAMRAARAALGNVPLIREDVRAAWRWRWLDQLVQDVRCGVRNLRRNAGFTTMSVATLALTIGATTAVFSVVHGILLRPLPVTEPDRLFRVLDIGYIGELLELRERARTFDVSAYRPPNHVTLTGFDEPLRVSVVQVTGDLLARVGRTPVVGPGFRLDDERPGAAPAAVLSHDLWRRRFGADPAAVGRMLTLDGVAHQVRGIMPADFEFPSAGVDLWVPMTVDAASPVALWARTAILIGRLRPGATMESAAEEVGALAPQFARLFPWRMPDGYGTSVRLRTWREDRLGEVRPMLFLLLAAVAAVWLIGAVNLTNLQQVRVAARRRELALRTALGAGRGRVVRQLLTESTLVSLLGGTVGLAAAYAGVPALVALLPGGVPGIDAIRVNGAVLAFTTVLSLVTALASGTLPALRAARAGEGAARSELRGSVGGMPGRSLGVFVTVEVAAAVTLVIGAALLARSLAVQLSVDVGFSADQRVAAEVAPSPARYPNDTARLGFYTTLERRLRALPFVRAVGLSTVFEPFGAAAVGGSVFLIEGRPNPATEGGEWPWADLRTAVSSDYLNTLGVSMVAGRPFTEDDVEGAQRVVLVSERLAEAWWPGTSAVGRRIRFPGSENEADPWRTVVGVVADVRWQGPASEGTTLYLPQGQHVGAIDEMFLVVQSSADSRLITQSLQAVVAALDPETPVSGIRVMDDIMAQTVSRPRFTTLLVLGFAVLGVVLGMVGVYGVVAYAAARQRRDIGIRLALGATRARVRTGFVRRALLFACAGVVIGELAAAVLMPSLSSLLFGVSPWDPFTYAAVPALFVVLAGLAAYVPVRRATGVDPALVLRAE